MKIKKIISLALAFCLIGGTAQYVGYEDAVPSVYASDYTEGTYGDLTYKNYGSYIEICDCDLSVTALDIPTEIDGVPVASIGYIAFECCSSLKSIIIPESVDSIGYCAFEGCTSLTSITIKNSDCQIYCNPTMFNTLTIYGYTDSTAQAYAEKYGITFASLGERPIVTTTTTTITVPSTVDYGDVNSDNVVDAIDASLVLSEYARLATGAASQFNAAAKTAADVNTDGIIDAIDASLILSYYAYTATGGMGLLENYLWKAAYKGVITSLAKAPSYVTEGSSSYWYSLVYSLYDMNQDGIPELLVHYGSCIANDQVRIYTYKNNAIELLYEYGGGSRYFDLDNETNQVCLLYGRQGGAAITWYLYDGYTVNVSKCVAFAMIETEDGDWHYPYEDYGTFGNLKGTSVTNNNGTYYASITGYASIAGFNNKEKTGIDFSLINNYQ